MSSTKLWNNLTSHLKKLLSDNMEDSSEVNVVMKAWEKQKSVLLKMVGFGGKKVKDPDAPKKNLSSYIFYCNEVRNEIKEENPDMKATEITSELGKRWKSLTDKEKKKYVKMSLDDKKRYEEEMKDYVPPDHVEEKKRQTKKERVGPKRPMTAYFYFAADIRPQLKEDHPDLKVTDLAKLTGQKWKTLSDDEKQLFNDLASKDKERYLRECEDAGIEKKETKTVKKSTKTTKPVKKPTKTASKKKPAKKVADDSEPEEVLEDSEDEEVEEVKVKPKAKHRKGGGKKTGYILFSQENRDEVKQSNPSWKPPQVTKELSKAWKELSEEERDEWNERAMEASVLK